MTSRRQDEIDAEAATWLALIDGPERSAQTDRELRRWLAADPAHAAAFERASDIWDMAPGAARLLPAQMQSAKPARSRAAFALAASIALAFLLFGSWNIFRSPPAIQTAIGTQQTETLADGSRVSLNTESSISVRYSKDERRILLGHGEVLFEVRKDRSRPFIVEAGNEEIRALGTTFIVRRSGEHVTVTLLEGKVAVNRKRGGVRSQVAVLAPGERVTLDPNAGASLDRPSLESVTAWRRGEAVFSGTPLIEAAAELNRYGRTRIIVDDPSIASLPVSGVFTTSDVDEFAEAIAEIHGLRVVREQNSLHISR